MSNKNILELILKTSGFTMEKYELIRDGSSMVGYKFEAHQNGVFEFEVATDSFESAVRKILEYIYSTENVTFNTVF